MEIQNNKHLHEDYNIVIKLTTNCPANCKCCSNRKRETIVFLKYHILTKYVKI
mgnify:CR=1 FL=1